MLDLVITALAEGELKPVLDGAEERLKVLAKEVVATHTAHAELSLKQSAEAHEAAMGRDELSLRQSAEAHAAAFRHSASEAARDLGNQVARDVEQQLSSYRGKIVEVVQEKLSVMLQDEVARHVRSGPLFSAACQSALKLDPQSASNRDPSEAVGSGLSR